MKQTADGGYILNGYSLSPVSGDKTEPTWGAWDFWVVKTDSMGNKQWDKDFGGTSNEYAFSYITQTTDGGYLFGGESESNISGDKTENNLGTKQGWVIKTDSLGNKQWDKTLLTTGDDEFGFAIQTKDGCFAMANASNGGIGGEKTQYSWGSTDYWIIKFCDSTATTTITQLPNPRLPFSIYPNPADELLVASGKWSGKEEINIYDLFGRITFQSTFINQRSAINIDISNFSPGIYFLKAGNEVRKFIKE